MATYVSKYDEILGLANKQFQADYEKNSYKDEERRLIVRLGEYKDNHLLFMYDFNIPFSNNRAEADIRPAKRKQNIGIFRSKVGAKYYLPIRSFISTFLKNNKNVFRGIKDAFNNKPITLE
jgi:transposase